MDIRREVGAWDTLPGGSDRFAVTLGKVRDIKKRAEAAEARLAAIIGAHQGPMESCAERIKAAEALLVEATAKLQRVRDALVYQANSEGGLVAEIDKVRRRIRAAASKQGETR